MEVTVKAVFCFFFVFGLTVNAQTINVRGRITNKTGEPISKAIVALVRKGLTDTTEIDGSFSITNSSAIISGALPPETDLLSLNRGVLEFSLINSAVVKVKIYNVNGCLVKKVFFQHAAAGDYRLNITKDCQAANMLIIHTSIGSREITFPYIPLNRGKYTVNSSSGSSVLIKGKLAKTTAAVDTLRVTAMGYNTKLSTFFSYDTVLTISLDTVQKISGNWRLERATCTIEGRDSCRVGLQICPSFYSFSDNRLIIYSSSYEERCTRTSCDTTIYCYDTLKYDLSKVNDTTYRCWGDPIKIVFKGDTLVFERERLNLYPKGTKTYYFVREIQPIPYCSVVCVKRR